MRGICRRARLWNHRSSNQHDCHTWVGFDHRLLSDLFFFFFLVFYLKTGLSFHSSRHFGLIPATVSMKISPFPLVVSSFFSLSVCEFFSLPSSNWLLSALKVMDMGISSGLCGCSRVGLITPPVATRSSVVVIVLGFVADSWYYWNYTARL